MAFEVMLPKLGMNTDSATIVTWLRAEGDHVSVGDPLAEVETDKAAIELEAEAAGVLRRQLAAAGDRVVLNQPIAIIAAADEDISALLQPREVAAAPRHVERIYEVWRATPAPANGHATPAATTATPAPSAAQPAGGFDAAAIRARLAQRGVIEGGPSAAPVTRLAIYGSGLGAKQLLEVTRQFPDLRVVGLIDDDPDLVDVPLGGTRVLGGFGVLAELLRSGEVDAVALSFHSEVRKRVHERLRRELDARILPLVDPRAIVGMDVTIEAGALIEAGAVIGPGTTVGEGTIVDVGAVVAHDCYLGAFSHLSPGCALSGVVHLAGNVLIGAGASVNSTVSIGANVIVTPGSAVVGDIPPDSVVSGVPGKVIGESRRGSR